LDSFSTPFPYYYLPVSPTLTIDDGNSPPLVANLLNVPDWTWVVASVDYLNQAPFDANGIGQRSDDGLDLYGLVVLEPDSFNALNAPMLSTGDGSLSFSNPPDPDDPGYSTNLGVLLVTDYTGGAGTFSITAVPETSTTLPMLTLVAGALLSRRRTVRLR
jgi:hypothetical protein